MECGQIDLAHLLNGKTGKPIKIDFIRLCWQQMLEAVYTIQLENIVHSDLKPANFIVINGSLKLIDFGIARTIPNDTTNIHREQQVGTINYMSPESIQGNNNNVNKVNNTGGKLLKLGRASDVWSLGCILYQLVYGHTPFSHLTMIEKIKSIPDPDFPIEFPPTSSLIHNFNRAHLANQENNTSQYAPVDANLLRIMKSCLKRNPKDRVTIPELLADPFLSGSHVPCN
ncbi:10383_t:CDS:2 [Scutellospora calospora]|uniref:10383_t:CDS:1 n=1 Tax=Scutellospora calospora TaxID=85575 RepID=A0ACA9L0I9_9GLOM|nr:10383_t:CDS:2 [Scutellospora calospora]